MSGWNPPEEPAGEACPVCQDYRINEEDFCCMDCKEAVFEYTSKLSHQDGLCLDTNSPYPFLFLTAERLLMGERVENPDFHIRMGKMQLKMLECMHVCGRLTRSNFSSQFPDELFSRINARLRSLYDRGFINASPQAQPKRCFETGHWAGVEYIAGFTITDRGEQELSRRRGSFAPTIERVA